MTDRTTSDLPEPADDRRSRPGVVRAFRAFAAWPGPARAGVWVVAGLVLVLVAGVAGAAVLVRRPLPEGAGRLQVAGLDGTVEVVRDDHGIPQLYADTSHDLFLAQGYVHAQERFFEMDVRRHATAGRLAELFGEPALASDKTVRTMGWRRVAARELALVDPDTRAALTAYAEGVNAYLDSREPTELAVEYTLLRASGLDYAPQRWNPVDSLSWLKAMAWDLRGNMDAEIERVTAAVRVGVDRAEELFPAYPYAEHAPIVEGGAVVDGAFVAEAGGAQGAAARPAPRWSPAQAAALEAAGEAVEAVPALLGHGDGLGSNSWAVSGEHTATGAPLLANDPHLGVSLPGVWMQAGLHCRTVGEECPFDVAGFTFAGVPGVVIGHNADIAWGFTNLGPDVTDLFLERVRGDRYLRGDELVPLRTRTETIEVRDGEDFELVVRETAHGPLLSDVSAELSSVGANAPTPDAPGDPDRGNGYAVALAWTALRPSPTADAILGLNLATDWQDFRAAAADFTVPAQNLVYADRDGHVGYQAPGRVPVRGPGNDGRWPAEGWRASDDWVGTVPFAALPSVLDPEDGVVVTANQAVAGPDYPVDLTDDWDLGYRAQRIRERLEGMLEDGGLVDVPDMLGLQRDSRHPAASAMLPHLLAQDLPGGFSSDGQRLLEDWDGTQPADGAAAAYFNAVWAHLLRLAFHDELPPSVWPDGGDRWVRVVDNLLGDPLDPWWDDVTTDDVRENRDDVLSRAMLDARDELTRLLDHDADDWEWGRLHTLDLQHQTVGRSGNALAERLLNREGFRVPGGSSAVDATSWDAAEGYAVTAAPSMRMVVSLSDWDASRWISLTGVSGHPGSGHYVDQTELWVDGRTLPWAFTRDAVAAAGTDVTVLEPAEEPSEEPVEEP